MRLLSYNMHKGIGPDRRYRIERILDVIEEENPDLICLQEVDRGVRRSRFHDQARLLVQRLGPRVSSYQMNVRLKQGGYGNLILSRWKFEEKHQISLRVRSKKPRGAQIAVVASPEGPLYLVNWHLGLAEKERHQQVRTLLGHRFFHAAQEFPALLVGDTNDWRDTLIRGDLHAAGFIQATAPRSRFRSFPSWLPVGSLDKAFVRGPLGIRHARVVRSRRAKSASDHLPLVVDFHLG